LVLIRICRKLRRNANAILLISLLSMISTFCLAGSPTTPVAPKLANSEFFGRFESVLQHAGVPGGAIALLDGSQMVVRGIGQRGLLDPRPVDAHTVFRVASVSKTFTAQMASLLIDDGVLSLDSKVGALVPELRFAQRSHSEALTLGHLLSHSSGITPYAYDTLLDYDYAARLEPGVLQLILPKFRKLKPVCAPGRCYGYQNALYSVSALMMQAKTGQSLEQLVSARVFKPLGMRDSSYGLQALQSATNQALPHLRLKPTAEPVTTTVAQVKSITSLPGYYHVAGAAGVNSSAHDLGIWVAAQLGAQPNVISPKSVQRITTAQVRTTNYPRYKHWDRLLSDAHYAHGWRVFSAQDETIYFHGGWVQGYLAGIAYSRAHRLGIVMLINSDQRVLDRLMVEYWCEALAAKRQRVFCEAPASK
jgi:beta-lactamase class C